MTRPAPYRPGFVEIAGAADSPRSTAVVRVGVTFADSPAALADPDLAGRAIIETEVRGPQGGSRGRAAVHLDDAQRRATIRALGGIPTEDTATAVNELPMLRAVCDVVGAPYHPDALPEVLAAIRTTAGLAADHIEMLGNPYPVG